MPADPIAASSLPRRQSPASGFRIDRNAGGRRNETRTDKNDKIGRKYLRRRKGNGERGPEKKAGKKVPSLDSTAAEIAKEEKCFDRHVKNCLDASAISCAGPRRSHRLRAVTRRRPGASGQT